MADKVTEERELVRRIVDGDEHAFRIAYDRYKNKLFTFCFKLTKSEETALEIVHDVFLKVWLKRKAINEHQSFNALLFTITKNLSLNFLKKAAADKSLRQRIYLSANGSDNVTEDAVIYSDYEEYLQKAIRHLPPQQQLVFTMSRIDGLSHSEIAESLHLSKGTVKKYIMLAVSHVSRFLNLHSDKSFFLPLLIIEILSA